MTRWWDNLCAVDITAHVLGVLLTRHMPPEWAVFEEFAGGTGTSTYSDRAIDLLAVHLWADRKHSGPHVVAYEIKASRGDFSKELSHPEKRHVAERIATDCYFATPIGLVREDEVPAGWGLIEVTDGSKSRIVKHAQQREIEGWPWPVVRSLARRVHRVDHPKDHEANSAARRMLLWKIAGLTLTEAEINEVVRQHYEEHIKHARSTAAQRAVVEYQERSQDYKRLQELASAVGAITGQSWNPTAEKLRTWIQEHTGQGMSRNLRSLLRALRDGCDAALTEKGAADGLDG